MMRRVKMTPDEVAEFNPRWDDGDRRQVRALLHGDGAALDYKESLVARRAEIDAAVALIPHKLHCLYRTVSRCYVRGIDCDGVKLFGIRPGGLDLYCGVERTIVDLSTVGWCGERKPSTDVLRDTCPRCFIELPRSGVCGSC